MVMRERQLRFDEETAKAVARGVNILAVRGSIVARRYMEYKHVPASVIARVVNEPAQRRRLSAEQAASEAIAPSKPTPPQE
jgi:hypothetical protein